MRERIAIFPIDSDNIYILDNSEKFQQYELIYGIVPQGWDIKEEQIENYHLICKEQEFVDNVNNVDTIILCDSKFVTDYIAYQSLISLAKKNGLKVTYLDNVNSDVKEFLDESCLCIEYEKVPLNENPEVKNLTKPVIMVTGFGENCEKMQMQLSLYDFFKKKNYKPCLITSNIWGKLMGFHTLPEFIFENKTGFTHTVKGFAYYVKQLEMKEDPDVIIIGVPGAPAQLNRVIDCDYGYIPFLITSAVKPDIGILSLYCGEYKKEHFEELKKIYYYRFGINNNYFHISRKISNYNVEQKKLEYYSIDKNYMIEKFMNTVTCVPIYHVNDTTSKQKVYEDIMNELINNIEIM